MTAQEFERLRVIELEILKEFEKVCNKLELRYFCIYGTALGAVRHKGYIPWDDDIDVGMPRKDYEIFMEQGQDLLPENYFVQSFWKEKEYLNPFGKLRRSDTAFIEAASEKNHINHGIYIDIFPLDGYPKNKFSEFMFKWKRIVYDSYIYKDRNQDQLKQANMKNKILRGIGKIFIGKMTAWEAVAAKDKLVKRVDYDEADIVGVMVEDYPAKEAVPKEFFGNGEEVEFEQTTIRIPENWEGYLRHTYGDYMKLPPKEERYPLHVCEIIDFEKSYTYYEEHEKME